MEANASGMICPKCGTQNAAGDAFCGGCGAFLEFAAEEAGAPGAAAPDAAQAPPGPSVAVARPGASPAPGGVPASQLPAPAASASPAPAPPPVPSAAPSLSTTGPTCPVCGRANPAGRTFCISCGERLPVQDRAAPAASARPTAPARTAVPGPVVTAPAVTPHAAPTAGPTAGPIASAGAVAPATAGRPTPPPATGPTWEFPSGSTRPVAPPSATPVAAAPAARRGRNPLPLVVGAGILFLLLAGGGAAILLGGGGSKATPAPPGAGASAPTSSTAGASLPGASAAASPATAASPGLSAAPATLPPGPAVVLALTGASASSSLANHPPSAAIDGDPTTSWKAGTPSSADQWLEVTFAPAAVTQIQLWNGWQRTQDIYFGNDRPRNVTIRFDNEIAIPLKLVDVEGSQRVDIPSQLGVVGVTRLRITIVDWYPAKKTAATGSPTTQAPISEIRLFGIPVTP